MRTLCVLLDWAQINSYIELELIIIVINSIQFSMIDLKLNWEILNWNWIRSESLNWSELINSVYSLSFQFNVYFRSKNQNLPQVTGGFPSQRASNVEGVSKLWHHYNAVPGCIDVFNTTLMTLNIMIYSCLILLWKVSLLKYIIICSVIVLRNCAIHDIFRGKQNMIYCAMIIALRW